MAILDKSLEWKLKKGIEIINNLPEGDRKYVETYVNNLQNLLDKTREDNRRMREIFKTISYYGR